MTIPASWKQTELGEILLSIVGGGTPSKSIQSYYEGNIPWMSVKDMNRNILHDTVDHISEEAVKNSSTNVIPSGTPIVATRMSLGKIIVANFDSAINQDLKALFPASGVNREYLIDWYRSISRKIEELGTGTTVKGIRLDVLKSLEFPLPPPEEQKVIADKLDTLLTQVETTKTHLERIPEILKTFRQSVLAAAVSGKLNAGDYQQAPVYKALGDVGVEVKTGPFGSALHKSEYISGGIPVINPMHISNGTIVASQQMTIPKAKYDELEAWHLKIGDVVVGRRGEMGRAAVVNYKGEMLCGTGSMILRTPKNSLPKYLEIILRSPLAVEYFTSNSVGSTMVNLNQKIIKSLQVHFPSQEEQTEIVRRVEKLFAYADKVEAQVKTAQARVNQLTQSILAKAFRGELTANWRAANPELISGENSAEALLVIIKNERAKLSQTKKGRGKSVEN
jgi:type I restriction enzyme S subunit